MLLLTLVTGFDADGFSRWLSEEERKACTFVLIGIQTMGIISLFSLSTSLSFQVERELKSSVIS